MPNISTSIIHNGLIAKNVIINFSTTPDSKDLFDHRMNSRAHPGRGGSPRG
jgi:hypothetical protein